MVWNLKGIGDSVSGWNLWLKPNKTYSFGRRDCDINVPENYVSRNHCQISTSSSSTTSSSSSMRTTNHSSNTDLSLVKSNVFIIDMKSKVKTFKLESIHDPLTSSSNEWKQIDTSLSSTLLEGSYIRIGSANIIFQLVWIPVSLFYLPKITDSIHLQENSLKEKELVRHCENLELTLEKNFSPETPGLVVLSLQYQENPKIYSILGYEIPIVSWNWLETLTQIKEIGLLHWTLPPFDRFIPPHSSDHEDSCFLVKEGRRRLFVNKSFVFKCSLTLSIYKEVITACSGSCILLTSTNEKSSLLQLESISSPCLMTYPGIKENDQQELLSLAELKGLRTISIHELRLAILEVNVSLHCNPRSRSSSQVLSSSNAVPPSSEISLSIAQSSAESSFETLPPFPHQPRPIQPHNTPLIQSSIQAAIPPSTQPSMQSSISQSSFHQNNQDSVPIPIQAPTPGSGFDFDSLWDDIQSIQPAITSQTSIGIQSQKEMVDSQSSVSVPFNSSLSKEIPPPGKLKRTIHSRAPLPDSIQVAPASDLFPSYSETSISNHRNGGDGGGGVGEDSQSSDSGLPISASIPTSLPSSTRIQSISSSILNRKRKSSLSPIQRRKKNSDSNTIAGLVTVKVEGEERLIRDPLSDSKKIQTDKKYVKKSFDSSYPSVKQEKSQYSTPSSLIPPPRKNPPINEESSKFVDSPAFPTFDNYQISSKRVHLIVTVPPKSFTTLPVQSLPSPISSSLLNVKPFMKTNHAGIDSRKLPKIISLTKKLGKLDAFKTSFLNSAVPFKDSSFQNKNQRRFHSDSFQEFGSDQGRMEGSFMTQSSSRGHGRGRGRGRGRGHGWMTGPSRTEVGIESFIESETEVNEIQRSTLRGKELELSSSPLMTMTYSIHENQNGLFNSNSNSHDGTRCGSGIIQANMELEMKGVEEEGEEEEEGLQWGQGMDSDSEEPKSDSIPLKRGFGGRGRGRGRGSR